MTFGVAAQSHSCFRFTFRSQGHGLHPASPQPAQIAEAIEITENLIIHGNAALATFTDGSLAATPNRARPIQRSARRRRARRRPATIANILILLQSIDLGGEILDHVSGHNREALSSITLAIFGSNRDLSHQVHQAAL